MSATKLNIGNQGVLLLGGRPLTSWNDGGKTKEAIDIYWDTSYRATLSAHRWHFATTRALLNPLTEAPVGAEWSHQFQLPNDCLKVQSLSPDGGSPIAKDAWRREGRKLLANADSLILIYTYICPVGDIDATFEQALAAQLAYQMAYFLTGSTSKGRDMFSLYQERLDTAKTENGIEQTTQPTYTSQLLEVRR